MQLEHERTVKTGVLPLMQAFATKESKIGSRIRESGLVERCETQISNAGQRLEEIVTIQKKLQEEDEMRISAGPFVQRKPTSGRITGRKLSGENKDLDPEKMKALEAEEAHLELQVSDSGTCLLICVLTAG